MNSLALKLYVKVQCLLTREDAQDLTEYALVVSLIAVVCIAGVNHLATAIKTVFTNIDAALF